MTELTRRALLAAGLGLTASTWLEPAAADVPSLANDASAKGLLYGCAVGSDRIAADRSFAALVAAQAGIIVPEWELKREFVQRVEGQYDFGGGDDLYAFAVRHGLKMRGHTLVWYYGTPPWLEQKLQDQRSESLLTDMITRSCRHYRGRLHSWDVLNEVVEPPEGHPDGLRVKSPWYQAFGEDYMAIALHAAREADPNTLLFYGDYDVEMDAPWQERRRTAVLKVLERLKKQNAPIDAFGVQGHLKPYKAKFDEDLYARFLRDVAGFGLKIMVTEFDVADRGGPADIAARDADVAAITRSFMDVSLASPAMLGVLTWGLSDRYSWLSNYPDYKWPDGQLSRGLPFDGDLKPKPMRQAMAQAFAAKA
ncbi:beta-xylanase [Labrys miyagiensis]